MRFKELCKAAKQVAVKEFMVDHEQFFKENEDDTITFFQAYRTLRQENNRHHYDTNGILVSNGGMY